MTADTSDVAAGLRIDDEAFGCSADPGEDETNSDGTRGSNENRRAGRSRIRWQLVGAVGLVLASAGAATAVYLDAYRGDRASAQATSTAASAASQAAVALLSYAPASLDRDLTAARSHLTGGFLTYYSQFADQFVAPTARQKDIHATASVVRAATIDAHTDTAHVLVFLNQTITSRDNPGPAHTASSVNVGLTKVDGAWRISSFDPI